MSNQKIEGLVAAPFTPMNEDRTINLSLIPKLYERFRQNGVVGVFINGSTSEGLSLTTDERKALTEAWSEVITDDFKLLVHVGHAGIEDAKNLAGHAAEFKSISGISTDALLATALLLNRVENLPFVWDMTGCPYINAKNLCSY